MKMSSPVTDLRFRHLGPRQVRDTAVDDAVYYGTKLSGASNQKAKIWVQRDQVG
jgi:hypothetical protein